MTSSMPEASKFNVLVNALTFRFNMAQAKSINCTPIIGSIETNCKQWRRFSYLNYCLSMLCS